MFSSEQIPTTGDLWRLFGLADPAARALAQFSNAAFPNIPPSADTVVSAWRAGKVSDANAVWALRANGVRTPRELRGTRPNPAENDPAFNLGWRETWEQVWDAQKSTAGAEQLIFLLRLGLVDDEWFNGRMKLNGFWDNEDVNALKIAYDNKVPLPGELVSFALREAWDATTVERFQYDAEFPEPFRFWMQKIGADGPAGIGERGTPERNAVTWSKLYWRTHWANISPTQAYEMFQRLRPGRFSRYAANIPGLRAFTFQDLTQVLKVNDYPVPFRSQLAAIAYRKPRLVDIDRFYSIGAIDAAEVYEMHLDIGYSPADARVRTDWLVTKTARNPNSKYARRLPERIAKLYSLGRLSRAQALDRLIPALSAGEFGPEQFGNWDATTQRRRAAIVQEAERMLADADVTTQIANSQKLLNAWRRQYLRGMVRADELRHDMQASGFQADYVTGFIAQLNVELASGRLMLSTSQIRGMVVDGILPIGVAKRYLANLGWKAPELEYLTAAITADVDAEQARQQERLARTARDKERMQAAQIAAMDRARAQVVKRLNRQASPAQLMKYRVRGIIDEREYERELERRGFEVSWIKAQIQLARQDREAYLAKKRARAGGPAGGGGGGGQLPAGGQIAGSPPASSP